MSGWSFACPDWEDRLRQGRSLVPDLPLDAAEASRAVSIFNKLRLPDVGGQPTLAQAGGEWQRDVVRAAFGSLDPVSARRHVGEVFWQVPKKNSKTTGSAAIALTALLMNRRPNADLLLVGPTQEVAQTAYDQIVGMIDADDHLRDRFHPRDHIKSVEDRVTGAVLKIKTFDTKVMTGVKPIFVLLDELHLMSKFSYASRVMTQIRGGFQPFPESLFIMITTQSDEPPAGVYKAELQVARGVRDGRIAGPHVRLLPVIYEFPEAMQTDPAKPWADPKNWHMVLPNLGRSVHLDLLAGAFEMAKEKGEEEVRIWASQHLNVEIGLALHSARWRGADHWLAAAKGPRSLAPFLAAVDVVVGGIDGGGLDDLLGLALIGRERGTGRWLHWGRAWAHAEVLERRKDIVEQLRDFARDGDLVICGQEEPTRDVEDLVAILALANAAGLLPEQNAVGLDPAGVAVIVEALKAAGLSPDQLVGVGQGYRLNGAIKGAERKLKDGTLVHAGQALMSWSVGNAKAELRGSATVIEKATSGSAKIDPLMALFDAFHLMSLNPAASGRSVYEERGLRVLRSA